MRSSSLALLLAAALGCAGSRPPTLPPEHAATPEEALREFAGALRERRFERAHALLSARWRAAYTPRRLAVDLQGAGPAGREALQRALSALGSAVPERRGDEARLPLGAGRGAVLVREDGGWKVDALE